MKQLIESCKVIVFDLDGTLYEGTNHYDYYANEIACLMGEEQRDAFFRDYQKIKAGQHTVKVGTIYDMERDCVLTYDPFTNQVTNVHTWEGQALFGEGGPAYYQDGFQLDERKMIAIGDGWWYTYVTGAHHGVKDTYDCYNRTKEYMASSEFKIPKIRGLKELLLSLKGRKTTVLMTNSEREDVTRLLGLLELEHLFDEEITSANKPMDTEMHLQRILQAYQAQPYEIISIGDNFINEIAPALKIGMHGVYISPYTTTYESKNLIIVQTLTGLLDT